MKPFTRLLNRALCSLALGMVILSPAAQTSAQTRAPAQQQAVARDIDPNALANGALSILVGFDADKAGDLWDGASVVAKGAVKRNDFISQVRKSRNPLGAPVERTWITVRRQQVPGSAQLPPGTYASIEFVTRFQGNRAARELVSLRLDEDRIWRLAGYVIE